MRNRHLVFPRLTGRSSGTRFIMDRCSVCWLCELVSVAVGAARGALDIYEQDLRDRKVPFPPFLPRYETPDYQHVFGHIQGLIDTAEAASLELGSIYMEFLRRPRMAPMPLRKKNEDHTDWASNTWISPGRPWIRCSHQWHLSGQEDVAPRTLLQKPGGDSHPHLFANSPRIYPCSTAALWPAAGGTGLILAGSHRPSQDRRSGRYELRLQRSPPHFMTRFSRPPRGSSPQGFASLPRQFMRQAMHRSIIPRLRRRH
jgi:hypothetical protein